MASFYSPLSQLLDSLAQCSNNQEREELSALAKDCASYSNHLLMDIGEIAALADLSESQQAGFKLANITTSLAELTHTIMRFQSSIERARLETDGDTYQVLVKTESKIAGGDL